MSTISKAAELQQPGKLIASSNIVHDKWECCDKREPLCIFFESVTVVQHVIVGSSISGSNLTTDSLQEIANINHHTISQAL